MGTHRVSSKLAVTRFVVGPVLWMVLGLVAPAAAEVPSKKLPPEENGETLWLENCWHCHGKRALGDGPLAKAGPVPAPALAGRVPEEKEPWIVAVHRGTGTMPAFAPVFDRSATRDILTWLAALDPETGDGPSLADKEREKKEKEAKKKEEEAKKREEKKAKAQVDEDDASRNEDAASGDDAPAEPAPVTEGEVPTNGNPSPTEGAATPVPPSP